MCVRVRESVCACACERESAFVFVRASLCVHVFVCVGRHYVLGGKTIFTKSQLPTVFSVERQA